VISRSLWITKYIKGSGSNDTGDFNSYTDYKQFTLGTMPLVKNWSNNNERQDALGPFIKQFAGSNAPKMPDVKNWSDPHAVTLAFAGSYGVSDDMLAASEAEKAKEASESSESPKSDSADNVKEASKVSAPSSVSTHDGSAMACTDAVRVWSLAKGCGRTRCHYRSSESECMSDTVISGKHCCHWEQANAKGWLGFLALSSKVQRQTASRMWVFLAAFVPAAGLTILLGVGLFRSRATKEEVDLPGYCHLSA